MNEIRSQFPFLSQDTPWIYLDSAATTQKPQAVIDAMTSFYSKEYATVHRGAYTLSLDATARYQGVRSQVAVFLNAPSASEILFTKGTTEGVNLVAHSFGKAFLRPGDEILVTMSEHHSNLLPWQRVCQEIGAHLKILPLTETGELCLKSFSEHLSSKTKLLAIAHAANVTGTIHPIRQLGQLIHAKGGYLLVDGAQAAPHLPIDVQDLDADFYLFSGHKIYGPTGIGVLYGKRHLLEAMPPYQLGGTMVQEAHFDHALYAGLPFKFEAGTPPFAEVIGLGAALTFLDQIGKDRILKWENELLTYATERLSLITHLSLFGTAKDKAPILSFSLPPYHPLDIATFLSCHKIAIRTGHLCAEPLLRTHGLTSLMRASFGIYNTREEIDTFVETLLRILTTLGK